MLFSSKTRKQRGFSIVELVMSLALVGFFCILTTGIFISGIKSGKMGQDVTTATIVAESLLNDHIRKMGNFYSIADVPASDTTYKELNNTKYYYDIKVADYDYDTQGRPLIKNVFITVRWNYEGFENDKNVYLTGQGNQEIKISKTIYKNYNFNY